MSTSYSFKTNITVDNLRESEFLTIGKDEDNTLFLADKFNNACVLYCGRDGVIGSIKHYGANNPVIILYVLVKEFMVQFVSEHTSIYELYESICKMPFPKNGLIYLDIDSLFETYTRNFVNWTDQLDFAKEMEEYWESQRPIMQDGYERSFDNYIPSKSDHKSLKNINPRVEGNSSESLNCYKDALSLYPPLPKEFIFGFYGDFDGAPATDYYDYSDDLPFI